MIRFICLQAAVCFLLGGGLSDFAAAQSPPSSAESALATIFSPRRAPTAKTMGLVQRNFLDLVEVSRARLQVALVSTEQRVWARNWTVSAVR